MDLNGANIEGLISTLEKLRLIDYLEEYQYVYWSIISYYKTRVQG